MFSFLTRFWQGPLTRPVFVNIAPGTTANDLANFVITNALSISEIDPACRGEVTEIVINNLKVNQE